LLSVPDVEVAYDEVGKTAAAGEKSAGMADLALSASVAVPVATAATRILVTAIREWCARERHRRVEITAEKGSVSVVVTGDMDERVERIIRMLGGDNRPSEADDERSTS
ncbi:hypothetical protein, partial [Nocardia higoensis]|uniref:hypothetical protein n=1 Tax=Nocardia higoensis TaxID=228599 RepID=UPI001C3F162A